VKFTLDFFTNIQAFLFFVIKSSKNFYPNFATKSVTFPINQPYLSAVVPKMFTGEQRLPNFKKNLKMKKTPGIKPCSNRQTT
jgi:hypothetical protein